MKRPIPELLDHDRHAAPNIAPWPPKFLISDFGLVPEDPDEAAALQAPYGTINVEAELELRRSAAEVQNVAAGFGTLYLMKSGGIVRIGHERNTAAGEAAIRSWAEMSTPHALSVFDRHTLYAAICLGICIGCLVGLYL
jgi:hypothetical protein